MAKRRHEEPSPGSSRNALLILGAGGIVVAGLLVWALTRTVEPAPTPIPTAATEPATTAGAVSPGDLSTSPSTTGALTSAPPPASEAETTASVARIAAEDLRAKLGRGEVTLIDVRDASAFAMGHIPGALHIPFASVQSQLDSIPKTKPIVTYCT